MNHSDSTHRTVVQASMSTSLVMVTKVNQHRLVSLSMKTTQIQEYIVVRLEEVCRHTYSTEVAVPFGNEIICKSSPHCNWPHFLARNQCRGFTLYREKDLEKKGEMYLHFPDTRSLVIFSLAETLELCFLLPQGILLFRVTQSPVAKTKTYNKLMRHWQNSLRQNEARRNHTQQTRLNQCRTITTKRPEVSYPSDNQSVHVPEGNTIDPPCVFTSNSRPHTVVSFAIHYSDIQSFPQGRASTVHTPYLLSTADITICETQGELAVSHICLLPSLINTH